MNVGVFFAGVCLEPRATEPRGNLRPVLALVLNIRIINATTGEILRELILDPTRDYQGTGRPLGPAPKPKDT